MKFRNSKYNKVKEDTNILTCKLGNEIINCYDGTHNNEQCDNRFVHGLSRTRMNFDIATKIRDFYITNPNFTYKQIAEKFNVNSSATISDILNNKSYYNLKYIIMEV